MGFLVLLTYFQENLDYWRWKRLLCVLTLDIIPAYVLTFLSLCVANLYKRAKRQCHLSFATLLTFAFKTEKTKKSLKYEQTKVPDRLRFGVRLKKEKGFFCLFVCLFVFVFVCLFVCLFVFLILFLIFFLFF